jgi:hypothetical protein
MALFGKKKHPILAGLDQLLKRAESAIEKEEDINKLEIEFANLVPRCTAITLKIQEIDEHVVDFAGIKDEIRDIVNQIKIMEQRGINEQSIKKLRTELIPRLKRLKAREKDILEKFEKFKKDNLEREELVIYERRLYAAMHRLSEKVKKKTEDMFKVLTQEEEETDLVLGDLLRGALE